MYFNGKELCNVDGRLPLKTIVSMPANSLRAALVSGPLDYFKEAAERDTS